MKKLLIYGGLMAAFFGIIFIAKKAHLQTPIAEMPIQKVAATWEFGPDTSSAYTYTPMMPVSDDSSLLTALKWAQKGSVIFVTNSFTSGLHHVRLPGGVTLCSNHARITFTVQIPGGRDTAFRFTTAGDSVTVRDLSFCGTSGEIGDQSWPIGFEHLIKVSHAGFLFTNNTVENFPTMGVWLHYAPGSRVAFNRFKGIRQSGFGEPVWVGGSSYNQGWTATITGNIFEDYRHAVGSSGHFNSVVVESNLFCGNSGNFSLDRHNYDVKGYGGKSYIIKNNVFANHRSPCGIEFPQDSAGVIEISGNYTFMDSTKAFQIADKPYYSTSSSRVRVSGNYYGTVPETSYKPQDSTYSPVSGDTLSFWVNDSYLSTKQGVYEIQVTRNDTVIYREDCGGNLPGFHRVKVRVGTTGSIAIRLQLMTSTGYPDAMMWVDDVQLSGVWQNFDAGMNPFRVKYYRPSGSDAIGSGVQINDSFSGEYSFGISFGIGKKYLGGSYGALIIR